MPGPDKVVAVPGVGNVSFPDTMSDEDIATAIQKNNPGLAAPVSGTTPASSHPIWDKIGAGLNAAWAATPMGQTHELLQGAADWYKQQEENRRQENLQAIARGEKPPNSEAVTTGLGALGSTTGMGAGVTTPKGLATTAAIAAANTNPITAIPVDAALVAHGGYVAAPGIKKAAANLTSSNPDLLGAGLSPQEAETTLTGASEAVGGAAGLRAAGPAIPAKLNAARTALAERAVAPIVKKPLGATLEDIKFNRNPASALADEGLVGSQKTLIPKINQRVQELSQSTDAILQNHPNAAAEIDVNPIIDEHINTAQKAAKKVGNKGVVTRLEDLREALKTEYGPTKGTPFEMNNLKRDIGDAAHDIGAFKATDPVEASAAKAMGDVYSGIKRAVNEKVPEVTPNNERVANLLSAKTGISRNAAMDTNKSILDSSSLYSAGAKVLKNTVTSAPVRTGVARVLNAGRTLEPPAFPASAPASAPAPVSAPAVETTPFDEWLAKAESPEVEHVAEPTGPRGNGSGAPGQGGLEEAARQASGLRYFKVSPDGKYSPITGFGAQDMNLGPGWRKVQRTPSGIETEIPPPVRVKPKYYR